MLCKREHMSSDRMACLVSGNRSPQCTLHRPSTCPSRTATSLAAPPYLSAPPGSEMTVCRSRWALEKAEPSLARAVVASPRAMTQVTTALKAGRYERMVIVDGQCDTARAVCCLSFRASACDRAGYKTEGCGGRPEAPPSCVHMHV